MNLTYKVIDTKYKNVYQLLKNHFNISAKLLKRLKDNKYIYLNSSTCQMHTEVNLNDVIDINLDFEEDNSNIVPKEIILDIIYEDEWMLIVNKPSNMAIHPSANNYDTSLSNGIKYYYDLNNIHKKIRPVNRLDKDTSGIVIFAKSEYIQEQLSKQMQTDKFQKEYIAILTGILDSKEGTINAPIARNLPSIIERKVDQAGAISITHYKVLNTLNNNLSVVNFILETGRTHQIRVHSKYIGHPILGDSLYGEASDLISRQALHAYKITFYHPVTLIKVTFEASIPDDMQNVINNNKFNN